MSVSPCLLRVSLLTLTSPCYVRKKCKHLRDTCVYFFLLSKPPNYWQPPHAFITHQPTEPITPLQSKHPSQPFTNMSAQPNTLSESSGPPEIRPEEIILEELIGSGSFGKVWHTLSSPNTFHSSILHLYFVWCNTCLLTWSQVYKGRCRQKAVAVKILHKQQFDPQTLAVFRKEVYLMSKIYHPNVCLFMVRKNKITTHSYSHPIVYLPPSLYRI